MPAPSLASMAIRASIRNVTGITDVGDTPYDLIKPILKKIQNPDQLHEVETRSPHIADADAELWRAFIARDVPNWQSKLVEPKNPRSWWRVYKKMVREEQRAKDAQEEQLRLAMSGLTQKREDNKATFVDRIVPIKSKERAFVDGVRNPHVNGWGVEKRPVLKNATRGKDVLNALRVQNRQAAKDRDFNAGRSTGFATTKNLPNAREQIGRAPEWMVRELTKPAPAAVFTPKKGPTATETVLVNAEREARLKSLTQAKAKAAPPPAQPARPAAGARAAESTADREARLRALTQPKSDVATRVTAVEEAVRPAASTPSQSLKRPAPRPKNPAIQPLKRPATQPLKRPTPRPESRAIAETVSSRVAVGGSPDKRPSPAPELMRKWPPASSSPLMPAKRRKV